MKGYRLDSDVELLPGGAAFLRRKRVVVVADLHLGAEAALEHDGLSLPRLQTRKAEAYLRAVIEEVGPDTLVIAGDLKHNFSRNLIQEWDDVNSFVRAMAGLVSMVVVRGNHDNYLSLILRDLSVPFKKEHVVGNLTVVHGHTASGPGAGGRIIMGHIHPSIVLKDDAGARVKRPCFLFDRDSGILVLPALGIVSPGTDVVGNESSDRMSPVLPLGGLASFTPLVFDDLRPLVFPTVGELRAHDG